MIFKYLTLLLFSFNPKKRNSNRGFALLIVMVLGTVGTVASAAMLTRTRQLNDNMEVSITSSHQNLSVAETAKVNIQSLLIEHNQLLEYDLEHWEEYLKYPNSSEKSRDFNHNLRLCRKQNDWKRTKERILSLAQHDVIDVPMGQFSLVNLEKVDRNKILATIQTQNTQKNPAQYEIDINLSDNYLNKPVPVLWLTGKQKTNGIGEAKVKGNVWANDCKFPVEKVNLMEADKHRANYTGIKMPDLPNLESVKNRLPEYHYFPSIIEEEMEEKTKETEDQFSLELPREEDQATKKQEGKNVYEYLINDVDNIDSLVINSAFQGESKIILHIVGDINISEIVHKCQSSEHCSPKNLMIVAYEGSQMCLNFDKLEAFIVAPNYELGIKKKSYNQENAQFTGSIWADNLSNYGHCGNDQVEFNEAWEWGDLPTEFQSLTPTPKLIQVHLKESITPDS